MVQIWVSESIDRPFVSRVEGEPTQLNVSTRLTFEEIKSFVWNELSDSEWGFVYRLWADDSTERQFSRQNANGDFLITLKSE